jgi:hypothetical protein
MTFTEKEEKSKRSTELKEMMIYKDIIRSKKLYYLFYTFSRGYKEVNKDSEEP